MGGIGAWFLVLVFGCLLVVIGIQGSLGKMFAVVFIPADLEVQSSGQ
jgi:hypothetical protein